MIAPTYGSRHLTIDRGEGIYLYDSSGRKYFDLMSNYGVNILGHAVEPLNDAITQQLKKLTNLHGSFGNDLRERFAARLTAIAGMDQVFFCNSGTEAVEAAIKFSRLSGRKEILAARMGYHGKTIGSLSLTKTLDKYETPFLPLLPNVNHFSYNDLPSLKALISEDTAAVFIEPIQGEGGIRLPDPGFLEGVRKLCDENGALMVVDEIQTGMGRTGELFAIMHHGIRPDIMCLAKGLAGGMPIGATLMTEEVASRLYSGSHTNTFGGNPLVCAAGMATLDIIERENLLENATDVGSYLMQQLRALDSNAVREVRGRGLMIAVELKRKVTRYAKALQEAGVLVIPTGANIIRLLPPLILTREDVDDIMPLFRENL